MEFDLVTRHADEHLVDKLHHWSHIPIWLMLKRLAAFLFIFVIAGQVSAGVCGCVGSDNKLQHSCCKRQKTAGDSISKKGCCDTDCMVRQSERQVQVRAEPGAHLQFQAVDEPSEIPKLSLERVSIRSTVTIKPFANHRLKYARPPELYLRHRAFLI